MKARSIPVSDHAVLRYLQRVLHIDVEAHRDEIARIVALAEDYEGATAVTKDGYRYCLRNKTVTTVIPIHQPARRTARCDRRQHDHD